MKEISCKRLFDKDFLADKIFENTCERGWRRWRNGRRPIQLPAHVIYLETSE
jgi:hypothetical protein